VVSGLLAFMSVTGVAGMWNLRKLTPELLPPAELYAGTLTTFQLVIHNAKRRMPSFLIRLECPGGQNATVPLVPRQGTASTRVQLSFPVRGRAGISRIIVSSPFPVNFFTRYWTFALDATFVVFPRMIPGSATGDGTGMERPGKNLLMSRGMDGELERISGYSGSEPLRMIHWKLSARGDDLLVKEFGRQALQPVIIDLDTLPGHTLEERISRAAWLVKRWVSKRPVGLLLDGRTIPAEAGQRHGSLLLTELALYNGSD
jgi:uncharacterized protein (DUF58 family)